jgi:hypothetical protein
MRNLALDVLRLAAVVGIFTVAAIGWYCALKLEEIRLLLERRLERTPADNTPADKRQE